MQWEMAVLFLLEKQQEKDENRLFLRWAARYQDEMSFDDFVEALTPASQVDEVDAIEISMDIIRKLNGGD